MADSVPLQSYWLQGLSIVCKFTQLHQILDKEKNGDSSVH